MKTITFKGQISTITAKVDRSIGARFTTPELTPDERSYFFELQNQNVEMTITPLDVDNVEEYKIDTELEQKSQGQRIRGVLFVLWKQNSEGMEWEQYYKSKTDKYIDWLKQRIED